MGILENAIRRGLSDAIGKAVGQAIKPKVDELTNKAAGKMEQAARSASNERESASRSVSQSANQYEGAFGSLKRTLEGYATEASKNMKICPNCKEASTADKKFCPACGAKLPEQTVAQATVCTKCGTQNPVGTKFCQECGEKLPAAMAEEQEAAEKNAAVFSQWDAALPQYPKWDLGGNSFQIKNFDGYTEFTAFFLTEFAAQSAVKQYRNVLIQNGFIEAGQYPSQYHLYKKVNGVCYHADTEHWNDAGSDQVTLIFNIEEPESGYNYVKPEPKSAAKGIFDLLKKSL